MQYESPGIEESQVGWGVSSVGGVSVVVVGNPPVPPKTIPPITNVKILAREMAEIIEIVRGDILRIENTLRADPSPWSGLIGCGIPLPRQKGSPVLPDLLLGAEGVSNV